MLPTTSTVPELHWFKVDVSNVSAPQIVAQGDVSASSLGPNVATFDGSIAVDNTGDVIINFTASGPNMFPSDYYMVQGPQDATFRLPMLYGSSDSFFDSGDGASIQRWGTYSTAVADPNNPHSFWISSEYISTTTPPPTKTPALSAWWNTEIARVQVTNPAAPPVLATSIGSTTFTAGDNSPSTPVTIDSGLTVSDADSATLASATVSVSGSFQAGQDVLGFTNDPATDGNITGSYDAGSGTLTLTSAGATATVAEWQQALRSVTYLDTAITPDSSTRTISFSASDGTTSSAIVNRNVTVAPTDQTPIIVTSVGSTAFAVDQNVTAAPVVVDGGLTISDTDSPTLASARVYISNNFHTGEDVLAFSNNPATEGNISGNYDPATGVMTLVSSGTSASVAQWEAALRAITYDDTADLPNLGMRGISFSASDGTKTSAGATRNISIIDRSLFGSVTFDPASAGGEVYQLYDGLLGQLPDSLGSEVRVAALEGGESLQELAHDFLSSAAYTAKFGDYTQSSDTAFVQNLYQTALHRQPESAGLDGWDNALASGTSREDVALGIVLSSEHQSDLQSTFSAGVFVPSQSDAQIARLYYGLLDRAPDQSGLAGWENATSKGMSLSTVAQGFIASPEYQSLHGTQTDQQFVDALYEGALGRSAEPGGEQGWMSALSQGSSRAAVALGIAESPEAQNHLSPEIETGFKLA